MTPLGRVLVALAAVIGATVLAIVRGDDTVATIVYGAAVGYVFADRTADARTTQAIAATRSEDAVGALVERQLPEALRKVTAANAAAVLDVDKRPSSSTTPPEAQP